MKEQIRESEGEATEVQEDLVVALNAGEAIRGGSRLHRATHPRT